MSFKGALTAASLLLAAGLPAAAQIEDSGLDLVNPWGMGFLEAGEPSLPTDMWRASNADDLLPLMREVRTHGLTPGERTLMRRMALSPASAPSGRQEPLLRAERARLMFELGESQAAAALMARLDEPPPGLNADEIVADLNLALGNEATACDMLSDPDLTGDYWAKLRAVCAALQGNTAGAEMAIEMALQQEVQDTWLLSAVFAASGELPDPPEANYASGLALAISEKAGLVPPEDPIPTGRLDLVAAMAERKGLPKRLRVEAAAIAAEAELIPVSDYRKLFRQFLSDPAFVPATPLESAFYAARDPLVSDEERSHALAAALEAAMDSPSRFSSASKLLEKEIDQLPVNNKTAIDAMTFARAAIASGNFEAAKNWATANTFEGARENGSYDAAFIGGLVVLANVDTPRSSAEYAGDRLVGLIETDAQKQQVARLFALWTALGIGPPASGRSLMLDVSEEAAEAAFAPPMLPTLAAAEANAAGEVILSTVGYTNGDPTGLDVTSLTLLLHALRRIGVDDGARQLALEATGYWKAAD